MLKSFFIRFSSLVIIYIFSKLRFLRMFFVRNNCIWVNKNRDCTTEGQCKQEREETDEKSDDRKQDLHADVPRTPIQIKGEDQTGHFHTPHTNAQKHDSHEIVVEHTAGNEGKHGK